MRLQAGCTLTFEAQAPTPLVLMLRPRSGTGQWMEREEYISKPNIPATEYTDSYGNLCQRLVVPTGHFEIRTEVIADTTDTSDVDEMAQYVPVENLPDSVLQFLLPSRYCESDRLGNLALDIVRNTSASGLPRTGYMQAETIRRWIYEKVQYRYNTSDASTSAVTTAEKRVGVCRDFSHLGIALCRSLNIPARMVVGYLYRLDPMDLHAWFEAFVGERWFTFDATQAVPRGNRIAVAYGRDAADVALATQFGPMQLTEMSVWVNEAQEAVVG
ncbi:MAG: transglutaminase family protein [Cytophagaceae bacterium]|nr:transglutaminase family protein [Cytophagaceae bacterium]